MKIETVSKTAKQDKVGSCKKRRQRRPFIQHVEDLREANQALQQYIVQWASLKGQQVFYDCIHIFVVYCIVIHSDCIRACK